MFQGLRKASPLYVLKKAELKVIVGEVVEVGTPVRQYSASYQSGVMTPPRAFVDIKVRLGEEVVEMKQLPADAIIADCGVSGVVVSESKDAIESEIKGFRKEKERSVANYEQDKMAIEACDRMLAELNPMLAYEAERDKKLEMMYQRLETLEALLSQSAKPKKEEK